ncbi:hypothetical protein GNX18_16745 [Microbulbifer sp. SH-1]|uniref:TnsA endonuclease N-terminal domain-containing protein n=1 Tax=Microbulbifer sp. SH-1 TaxID=2681547 RepID=UPI001408A837|nr:TnsA endonuclease N-terminal domain-containing protein [Microbulbifer sp. SH-1]QIL91246.1 hypothetical protein GNX18_16745 [Microbulbifer sp. SH-1]
MNIPARKLKKSSVKNINRFTPTKANGGKTILVESCLEALYCYHLEFDPNVETYFPQPRTFTVSNGFEENTYTPDFYVRYFCGAQKYIEVKPQKNAELDSFQSLFIRFKESLVNTNIGFLVVNELDIEKEPLISNFQKLYQFKKRPTLDLSKLYRCSESISTSLSLGALIKSLEGKANLREIYTWLALGYLVFDIESEKLTVNTLVEFHVN